AFLSLPGFDWWNIGPPSCSMALELGVKDDQLPQSIGELRVFEGVARISNRSIEAPEDLLERVVIAFAVSAGKIGVGASRRLEQRRIFDHNLIARIAMPHPEFVGPLLIPCHRSSCAADLDAEPVFPSRRNLTRRNASPSPCAHPENHGAEVFRIDRGFDIIFGTKCLVRKSFHRLFRL